MFIWCDFFLDDFDSGRYVRLTPDIDESYLLESPPKIRDPQLFESSIEMKSKYESKFTQSFLTMQPGDEVEIYGLTFFCPKNTHKNGGNMLTMNFQRIEFEQDSENEIKSIVLDYGSDTNNTAEDSNEDRREYCFSPKIQTEYGRYGGVKLWSIEDAAIPGEEEPNTYIICNSELFY